MTTKNFFIFQAVIALGYGIPLLLFPQSVLEFYSTQNTDVTANILDFVSRSYGALLTACGVAFYYMRNSSTSQGRRALLLLPSVGNPIAVILHILAILQNIENSIGWGTVIILSVLSVWAVLLLLKEKETSTSLD